MAVYGGASFYVFSGTGNSLRVARWAAARAGIAGCAARVSSLTDTRPRDIPTGPDSLIGLFMPTHGFTAPFKIISFAARMPRGRGTHAFVVATRAGTKFGKLFLPGMEGTAAYLIAAILALKGYSVRGVAGIDMPSNWTALHPGFSEKNARAIIGRARPKADGFIDSILAGRRAFRGFVCLALGIALAPISAGYLIYGRFMLAKLFFADNRCNGCGICARDCPNHAIRMLGKKRPRPYWTFSCESCMRCMGYCPEAAVQAGHSWAVIVYFITAIPFAQYLLNLMVTYLTGAQAIRGTWAMTVIQYPFFLVSLAAAYALFYLLTRIPAVNAVFAYTTLTRAYRRYHEPDTGIKELGRKIK
ncbi:MAG: EFR1 family ferrodoxin [Deltaproteobacteria bacterium]|nr:EFR1 family ferrodoxin [Candidatus Zymogenaceae bacterium]